MALIACSECGKNVSTKADACPHCGAPLDSILKDKATSAARVTGDRSQPQLTPQLMGSVIAVLVLILAGVAALALKVTSVKKVGAISRQFVKAPGSNESAPSINASH